VLKADIGHFANHIGDQPAHDGGGGGEVLLERAKDTERQRLARQQIVPQAVELNGGANLAAGGLVLDKRMKVASTKLMPRRPIREETIEPRRREQPAASRERPPG
jgi:uncharacterized ferritin-like protein (DUF455 family)